MLKRKAYEKLLHWKANAPDKTLLVQGARQIGKTFLIEEFARNEFDDYIKIDFLQDKNAAFLVEAASSKDLVSRLSLIAGKEVVPGKTLVFFDEVQLAPSLITLSKYLVQDGRFRLIMSGSLLGVEMKNVKSLPVGYMQVETMFPLDFEEFCWSQGVTGRLLGEIERHFKDKIPLDEGLHRQLVSLFRVYLVVGGMPEAVQTYIDKQGDLGAVRDVQRELVSLYREDISRYAGSRTVQVKSIYDAIPAQLSKENKRFELKALKKNAQFDRYANDFAWLVNAGAALKTSNVTEPIYMLKRTEEKNRFKLYMSDTGMLFSQYPAEVALAAIAGSKSVNFGSVYENVVAQELAAARVPLRYYRNSRRGEVDFLVETSGMSVVPIEVKSGKSYKLHVALNNLLEEEAFGIKSAYVISEANVSVGGRVGKQIFYLPFYMLPFMTPGFVANVDAESEFERIGLEKDSFVVKPPDFSAYRG